MLLDPDADGVIVRLAPSAARRGIALVVVYLLGALLIWVALSTPPAPLWAGFLILLGAAVLVAGERMRRATALHLELTTEEGLRDSAGTLIAGWDEIRSVERGAFAFKPSNGFLLTLSNKGPRAWAPGLYWKLGRRVGVGGVTPMRETKFMAEQIALTIAARDGAMPD